MRTDTDLSWWQNKQVKAVSDVHVHVSVRTCKLVPTENSPNGSFLRGPVGLREDFLRLPIAAE